MIKAIYGILGAILIWLCLLTSNMTSKSSDIKTNEKKIEQTKIKPKIKIKEKVNASARFENKYFKQVFFQQRRIHGAKHTFAWNGNLYTTDYKEKK